MFDFFCMLRNITASVKAEVAAKELVPDSYGIDSNLRLHAAMSADDIQFFKTRVGSSLRAYELEQRMMP